MTLKGQATVLLLILVALGAACTNAVPPISAAARQTNASAAPSYDNAALNPAGTVGNLSSHGSITGTVRLLIIAAAFSDVQPHRTVSQISRDYFGPDPSVASYYDQVSYGKLKVTGTVVGWTNLTSPMAHYGKDCMAIDDSDCTGSDASWQLAQDSIGYAQRYVNLNNFDYLIVVHSGVGEESSKNADAVWSVAYLSEVWIRPPNDTGKTFTQVAIVPEIEDGGAVALGVYCHEFSHLLGLPDIYQGRQQMMGPWELMDEGLWNGYPVGSSPAELSAWSRLQLGWLSNSSVASLAASSPGMILLNPLENPGAGYAAAKISTFGQDYYMVEVRRPIGFDKELPDHGIIAYKLAPSANRNTPQKVKSLTTALHVGDMYQSPPSRTDNSSLVDFKVFAQFANGSYLIGFGPTGFIKTATLVISFTPSLVNATVRVNGEDYSTDSNGTVTVLDYSGDPSGFQITAPNVTTADQGVRGRFSNWSTGSTSNQLTVPGRNVTLTATYETQYYINATSQYGALSGVGWYDENSTASVSITSPVNATQPGIRHTFTGWNGEYNGTANPASFRVSQPLNLTATWKKQFYLTVNTGGNAVSTGTGWYDDGTSASFALTPPAANNGTWYIFKGWTGDYSGPQLSGALKMSNPATVTAEWTILNWMTFQFSDSTSAKVNATKITSARLVAPNGTALQVDPSAGRWLQKGSYTVEAIKVLGINVVNPNYRTFATSPNGVATIQLNLFPLTFKAQDLITTFRISGATITLALPDGTREGVTTDSNGQAVFTQLPASAYSYDVSGVWVLHATGTTQITAAAKTVSISVLSIPSIVGTILSALAICLAVFSTVRRRGRAKGRAKRRGKRKRGRRNKNREKVIAILQGTYTQ